jgi:cell division protein FtsZ
MRAPALCRAINTDAQAQSKSLVPNKLNIGVHITRGLGAGGLPSVGRKAAEESKEEIAKVVAGADLVRQP